MEEKERVNQDRERERERERRKKPFLIVRLKVIPHPGAVRGIVQHQKGQAVTICTDGVVRLWSADPAHWTTSPSEYLVCDFLLILFVDFCPLFYFP